MNKLDMTGVQEVRWDKGDTVKAEGLYFILRKRNEYHQPWTVFLVHNRI